MKSQHNYWVVIPAAGIGSRMRADRPKQYLEIYNKAIIEYTLSIFLELKFIKGIAIPLAQHDPYWSKLSCAEHKKIIVTPGGIERCHSVLNGLLALHNKANDDDWVLVHDAARPCLKPDDVMNLIKQCNKKNNGGILALPVRDTMKRCKDNDVIAETVNREGLWHALTPQMFRMGELKTALKTAIHDGALVTDEAQAMERLGYAPLLIEADPSNLKITCPVDLELARYYLKPQERKNANRTWL